MSVDVLASMLTPDGSGVTHDTGTVVAVMDTTHVSVDLGDRTVTAYLPPNLLGAAAVGAFVQLTLSGNTYTVASGAGAGLIPAGAIVMWPTATAPAGWLICNGATFSGTTYPALAAALGGTTLPDLRGTFPVGKDSGTFSTLGDTGGEETHTLTEAEMPSHSHLYGTSVVGSRAADGTVHGTASYSGSYTTSTAGSDDAHNNLPPFYVVHFVIKT